MSPQAKNRVSSENFTVYLEKDGEAKIMIIISKKVAPRAVDRNRVKRLIKESLRQMAQSEANLKVIVKKNLAGAKMAQVKDELSILLSM